MAGYRREAIENVPSKWINDDQKCYQNRPESPFPYLQMKNGRNRIETALFHKIDRIFHNLMNSLLSYDDSEDRALTTIC